jgi:hypothetical protein
MNLAVLFPPPYCLQRRAWEAAYMLGTEYRDRLCVTERVIVSRLVGTDPSELDWRDIGRARAIYGRRVAVRV